MAGVLFRLVCEGVLVLFSFAFVGSANTVRAISLGVPRPPSLEPVFSGFFIVLNEPNTQGSCASSPSRKKPSTCAPGCSSVVVPAFLTWGWSVGRSTVAHGSISVGSVCKWDDDPSSEVSDWVYHPRIRTLTLPN